MHSVALISPTIARARATAATLSRVHGRLEPFSLERFLSARSAPNRVVLDPGAATLGEDLEFLQVIRSRLLWPAPSARLGAAISGIRDEPVARQKTRGRSRGASALLLEGRVTFSRAKRALARRELSRDWIVEDARRVKLSPRQLAELDRDGVRWFALAPIEVVALVAQRALVRAKSRWSRLLRASTPVWSLGGSKGP
jgi:hypothetical protein